MAVIPSLKVPVFFPILTAAFISLTATSQSPNHPSTPWSWETLCQLPQTLSSCIVHTFKKQMILADSVSAKYVKMRLGLGSDALAMWMEGGRLIFLEDNGEWYFPEWQFDANGPYGTLPGLVEVNTALEGIEVVTKISWFCKYNPLLGGDAPKEALRKGQLKEVLEAAHTAHDFQIKK